tara:strand:+ start:23303 stop:23488 length:186 start_codon:yes stop_codon:yes gene_type:complete
MKYIKRILEVVNEQEVDLILSELEVVAKEYKLTPYQVMVDLLQFKETEANDTYWQNFKNIE